MLSSPSLINSQVELQISDSRIKTISESVFLFMALYGKGLYLFHTADRIKGVPFPAPGKCKDKMDGDHVEGENKFAADVREVERGTLGGDSSPFPPVYSWRGGVRDDSHVKTVISRSAATRNLSQCPPVPCRSYAITEVYKREKPRQITCRGLVVPSPEHSGEPLSPRVCSNRGL